VRYGQNPNEQGGTIRMKMIRRPSHGTIAAYLALFVALGGTAYALDRGSITSREIARGAVKRSEIKAGEVGKAEIRKEAVAPSEIRPNAVRQSEIRSDAVGTDELAVDAVTGENVDNGTLALADIAREVATTTFDPPAMNPGDCVSENSLVVPNKQADDRVLVLPGSAEDGWNDQLTLDAYSATGTAANQISVTLCRPFGAGSADPGDQPLTVLLLG
jgi:hypothetical protein